MGKPEASKFLSKNIEGETNWHISHPCHVMWAKSRGRPCTENARAWWVMGVGCPLSHCHSAHIDCFPLHPLASLAVQPPLFHDPWLSHLHMHPQQKITLLAVCLWHWVKHKTENYEWVGLNSKLQRCQREPAPTTHHGGWMTCVQETILCCMPVPYLTMVVST
jgi:hypothetical protein